MNSLTRLSAFIFFFLIIFITAKSQDNVGIGTLTPNPKAILELSSDSLGLLLPRMTSAERMAITALDSTAVGLLVYDTNDSLFYFWNGAQWQFFPYTLDDLDWEIVGNDIYSALPGNVGIGTTAPLAKLHTVGSVRFQGLGTSTDNDVLTISSNGTIRTRTLGSDLWDGDDVNDGDVSDTNECNLNVFFDPNDNNKLTIVDRCGTIETFLNIGDNDEDKDSTNELQSLSLGGAPVGFVTLNITGGSGETFSIQDADASPTNELQTLSISPSGNNSITWNLSQGGGTSSFSIDDQDWSGGGTGLMYTSDLLDKVGIATATPAYELDVNGDIRTNGRMIFSSDDYTIENNGQDLLFSSDDDMRFETGDHVVRYYASGSEGIVNFELDGTDALTIRGNGSYPYHVGIGTTTPSDRLQVAGNMRMGNINNTGFSNGGNNFGNLFYFSGGPGFSTDSENSDPLFMARHNSAADVSELRIGIGDDFNTTDNNEIDRLSIGSFTSITSGGVVGGYKNLFSFEIENEGTSSNGPMLSISPANITHVKTYHGGLALTKPSGLIGQYINLARGSATVWSIGYRYNTPHFVIDKGNTNNVSFGSTPFFTILDGFGQVGLGVASPQYRLELPNDAGNLGKGLAFEWDTYSDGRFKKNREGIGEVLSKVKQLNPLFYQWQQYEYTEDGFIKSTDKLSGKKEIGFIAQEVYELFPTVVSKPDDEAKRPWTMDYPKLTAILTKAIQEQQAMLEQEQEDHDQTRQELNQLKTEVETLKQQFSEWLLKEEKPVLKVVK